MKRLTLGLALSVGLLGVASAQEGKEVKIPMTPTLKGQISQYAKQVTQRGCSGEYEASYFKTATSLTAAEFDEGYNQLKEILELAMAFNTSGNSIKDKLYSGQSAYIYANNVKASEPDRLTILSRQKIEGVDSLVIQACDLK